MRNLIKKVLSFAGLKISRITRCETDTEFLVRVCGAAQVDCILDIGANVGQTGIELRSRGYTGRIVSFEPQIDVFRSLQRTAAEDSLWECRNEGLGAQDQTIEMELSAFSPSSSMLKMESKHVELWPMSSPIGRALVPVRTLDGLADELNLSRASICMKLDVQGFESSVLKGAAGVLKETKVVFVELLFADLYEGQSRYFDVIKILEDSGLRFIGLFGVFRDIKNGSFVCADGLFVSNKVNL